MRELSIASFDSVVSLLKSTKFSFLERVIKIKLLENPEFTIDGQFVLNNRERLATYKAGPSQGRCEVANFVAYLYLAPRRKPLI